ncbi:MAG: urease accessory protein UreD, partial [Dongiaceae bacterium]
MQRTTGHLRLGFRSVDSRTTLSTLFQQGAAKARFPKVPLSLPPEAVIINTAGGLTGGDRLSVEIGLEPGAAATVTTQACERIYRSAAGAAAVETMLRLESGAELDWLPQETILFDRGRLVRRIAIDIAAAASLLAAESVVFGRTARGESVEEGLWSDRWRIRRDGRVIFADGISLKGPIAKILARPAVLAGARAFATIVYVAADAAALLNGLRAALAAGPAEAGASQRDGLL